MLSYILATYILLLLGGGFYYLFIKDSQLEFSYRKWTLLSIIALSLIIPFIIKNQFNSSQAVITQAPSANFIVIDDVYSEYCPSDHEMSQCYEIAMTTPQFCECTEVMKEHLVVYHANIAYDLVLGSENWFLWGTAIIGGFLLLYLLFRIGYLNYIVFKSEKELLTFDDGNKYVILYTDKPYGVASFQLLKKYIIWQEEMSLLSEEEKKAILWHEISHIQQKDTWIKITLDALQSIWVFNPAFYFLRNELDRLNEFIADEFAVQKTGSKKFYANILVSMKRYQKHLALAQALQKSMLRERIELLLHQPKPKKYAKNTLMAQLLMVTALYTLTAFYSIPYVDSQLEKAAFYETLSKASENSGQYVFCKKCKSWELETH